MPSLANLLQSYQPTANSELQAQQQMLALLDQQPANLFERTNLAGHFVAGALLLSPDLQATLLTHHHQLNRWLQPGGHADGQEDLLQAALREAAEESGINQITPLAETIFDLDVHQIPANAAKNEPAHFHYEARFLLRAPHLNFQISPESNALRWFSLAEIDRYEWDQSLTRLFSKWRHFVQNSSLKV